MSIIAFISKWGVVAYFVSSLIPLSKSDHWFIRGWDFPRLQLLTLGLAFAVAYFFSHNKKHQIYIYACLMIGIAFDLYRILPYSAIWPKETLQTELRDKTQSLSIITVNVLQKNEDPTRLLKAVEEKDPDIVFLLEVNERWIKDVAKLEEKYPHKLIRPLENTYGLALYSKLELEDAEIRELIKKNVPSIYAKVKLSSGRKIELFGLHPEPPRYETGDTAHRDAELIQVAKSVSNSKLPVIVMGDLNDVAWSHTTRLFRRISHLLDPRVGRGTFATFPANLPLIKFPLDYFFHSDELTLVSIKRLGHIGSDHFPMFIEFNLSPEKEDQQEGPSKDSGDEKESNEILRKVREE